MLVQNLKELIILGMTIGRIFLVAQGKDSTCNAEDTWDWSLGREYSWRRKWQSSIFAWEISWTGDPGRLQSVGSQSVGQDLVTKEQQQLHNSDHR